MEEYEVSIVVGILIGMALMGIIMLALGNSQGMVPIETVGKYMCEQHDMAFSKVEHSGAQETFKMKVYCTNQTKVDDGYLVALN